MEQEYAEAMKTLARQYYDHEISKAVYREKRKLLVDHMDNEFNGDNVLSIDRGNTSVTDVVKSIV